MFLDTDDLFTIPADLSSATPCVTNAAVFTDPALDIDVDDDNWVRLSLQEQQDRLSAKQLAEARAVAACSTCPMLDACREWAIDLGEQVFGVAGGLTHAERTGQAIDIEDVTVRGPLGQVRDDLIERWTEAGISTRVIAERLGCHPRTVERRRAGLSNGTIVRYGTETEENTEFEVGVGEASVTPIGSTKKAVKKAAAPLIPSRVTDVTAALFDALEGGSQRDRSEIADKVVPAVPRDVALAKAPTNRTYEDEDAKVQVGARKFVMNRIDIAVRSGRIVEVTTAAGRKLISLSPDTAEVWEDWRAQESAEEPTGVVLTTVPAMARSAQ